MKEKKPMFVNALGKHLPAIFTRIGYTHVNCALELAYLVECARYHCGNLIRLASGQGNVPSDFESGVDFSGEELNRMWRVMALTMEFEAFLTASKRFLDRARCCLGERLGSDCAEIKTLSGAINSKKTKIRNLTDGNRHFQVLQNAWNQWGEEVVCMRNHMEHESPFGGRSVGFTLRQGDKEEIRLFIPDRIPKRSEKSSKEKLSFNENRLAVDFARAHMINVDGLMASFMETLADEPSLLEINRKASFLRGDDLPDV